MSYIYEMDVAHLRISYILHEGLMCFSITTNMYNYDPYDRSRLSMEYSANIQVKDQKVKNGFHKSFEGASLQQVTEDIRQYFIKNPYKQSPVSKSPDDGTDSVITG